MWRKFNFVRSFGFVLIINFNLYNLWNLIVDKMLPQNRYKNINKNNIYFI